MPEPLNLDLLYDEAFPDDPFLSGRLRAEMERMGYGNTGAIRGDRLAVDLAVAKALLRRTEMAGVDGRDDPDLPLHIHAFLDGDSDVPWRVTQMPEPRQKERIHYVTGEPMAPCPKCGHLSGLSGIDGGLCLACMMDWPSSFGLAAGDSDA